MKPTPSGQAAAPDLVCPAGSLRALQTAVDAGADAVYLGLKDATNARNFAGLNFDDGQVREGVAYAHVDRFPQLKEEYFRNYKRIVYLAQNPDPELIAQAQQAADYLGLPLELRTTGYGLLEERLVGMMNRDQSP